MFSSLINMKLFELDIDGDSSEVYFNSIVSVPAHLRAALKFKMSKPKKQFSFNDEKQIVTGVVIAVDEFIDRYDEETNEKFQVVFRKAVADKIMLDYFKKGYANNLNFEHEEGNTLKSAYLIESYQIDSQRGNSVPKAFESQNLKDGSIIFSYKIEDKQEWELAKEKGGFSIEGIFNLIEIKTKNENMSLLKKLGLSKEDAQMTVEKFKQSKEMFAEATTSEGIVVVWDGELNEGTELFAEVDGVLTPAEGTHTLTGEFEGTVIEVAEGVVTSVAVPEEQGKDGEDEEEKMAKESEVAEAFEAIKADYESKIEALRTEFTAKVDEKDEVIKSLQEDFAKVKKATPANIKNKFSQVKETSKKEVKDVYNEVKNAIK